MNPAKHDSQEPVKPTITHSEIRNNVMNK